MSAEASKVMSKGDRARTLGGPRRRTARAETHRRLVLDVLEDRELLATLPASTFTSPLTTPVSAVRNQGNMSTPSVALDQNNPQKLVSVWTRYDPTLAPGPTQIVQYAISNDAGKTWLVQGTPGGFSQATNDPTTVNPTVTLPAFTNASVAFDRNDNFYILYSGHRADNSAGVLLLSKYNFSTGTPTAVFTNKVVTKWTQDTASDPVLAVDDNLATFTDPVNGNVTQADPSTGNVYIAWTETDVKPALFPAANYNPNRIQLVASSDGGNTFSDPQTVNDNGNFGTNRPVTPRLAISQGSAPRPAGTLGPNDLGSPGVPGGQVTVIWDDYGIDSRLNPPLDVIYSDRITNGGAAQSFRSNGGPIGDAGGGTPNSPSTTDFPINVNVTDPRLLTVGDFTVTVAIQHPADNELSLVLIPPVGSGLQQITLVANQTDAAGAVNTGIGLSGANIGVAADGESLGTTFDDSATRNIFDPSATGTNSNAAPYIGHFRPEFGSLDAAYAGSNAFAAAPNTPGSINGLWTLRITDFRNNNVGTLRSASINITSGLTPGVDQQVATTHVRALQSGAQVQSAAASFFGIGPSPAIASDNTLGAFSPYEGRLYVTYVDRNTLLGNPADNTDIFLTYSDDGGLNWSRPVLVNDDNAQTDGFSEGSLGGNTGRAQFQPNIAVDNITGTVVMSWYDARQDGAGARVVTMTTTSIDGGNTFSKDVYANDSQSDFLKVINNNPNAPTVRDAITLSPVDLGPLVDNQSGVNAELTNGFGVHQGLVAFGGHAYPVWSSNQNGGGDGQQPLGIRTRVMTFAAGPRVISITQGPVGQIGDTLNNTTDPVDGTPIASAFVVTFDRPIDPNSFTQSDVQVFYHDTTYDNVTGGLVPVNAVTPLNANAFGATQFRVDFAPRSGVGTYSLQVTGQDISDRIRSIQNKVVASGSPVTASNNSPQPIPASQTVSSFLNVNAPGNPKIAGLTVSLDINHPVASALTLTLISPVGTRILLARNQGAGGANYTGTTFDDTAPQSISAGQAPFTGTFRPVSPLSQLNGQTTNGTWQLEIQSNGTALTGSLADWSLSIQPGQIQSTSQPGNKLDQNSDANPGQSNDAFTVPTPVDPNAEPVAFPVNGGTPFSYPSLSDTLPLIIPGPHVVSTSIPNNAGGGTLSLDAPVNSLDVTFDRNINPATFTGASVLRMMGPTGQVNGPFTVSQPNPGDFTTFRISFPAQKLSGTYTVTLAPTITDSRGNALDTNLNAGLGLLRGTVGATDATSSVVYSSNLPVTIPDTKSVVSTINVPDNFNVQGLTVQLNITHQNDPDLQITLVSPDNTSVVLVNRGVGTTGTHANFQNTIFDDAASTLIDNGGPPFFGRFKPDNPLSAFNGGASKGTWKLVIDDNPAVANTIGGQLKNWSLTFVKSIPGSGLGESVSDQATVGFRIFNQSPTNPLSSTTWTSVGPGSVVDPFTGQTNNGYAGRIGAIAVDPSDPSGNTVYVGGASGGVWKTTNFLTTDPNGPTYIPLTDFGPNSGMLISSIAVFPRNNDPRQSIIIAGTGTADTTFSGSSVYGVVQHGVGFLRSTDGGATWTLLDSTNNNLPFATRDHLFSQGSTGGFFGTGTEVMKVVVDPHPTPAGGVIVYAAVKSPFASNDGGLYRSVDTGLTWQKMSDNSLGDATDVVLDYNSATVDAVSNPTGNVNIIYAAFPGSGVYISPNRGQVLNKMAGGNVDPLIIDRTTGNQVAVNNGSNAPTGFPGSGRIVLAKPDPLPTTAKRFDVENTLYEGWLYAAVVGPFGTLDGVYMTKDNGQTWTLLKHYGANDFLNNKVPTPAIPTNNNFLTGVYDPTSSPVYKHGNYDVSLVVDPNNPNVVYLGGTANGNQSGLIRIDATKVYDSHAVVAYDGTHSDVGAPKQINSTGRVQVDDNTLAPSQFIGTTSGFSSAAGPYLNLLQDPTQPFQTNSTVFVRNVANFTNLGDGVTWTPMDEILKSKASDSVPSSNVHRMVTVVDPLTGATRLIVGDDQGVFSGVIKADGSILQSVGTAQLPTYSRNGNLAIAQFLTGAAQPVTSSLPQFYGNGLNLGQTASDPNVINSNATFSGYGNIVGSGSTNGSPLGVISLSSGDQMGTGVAVSVDQPHVNGGQNLVYRYYWPLWGGNKTDFFQVSINGGPFISRTVGLEQTANDPQWPGESPVYANGLAMGNFAVNPLNGDQVMISSAAGRVFATQNQGQFWLSIAEPSSLDGSYASALAFGAPDPNGPAGVGNLNNFLYAGTVNGNIYVSQTGGGSASNNNAWTQVSTGLDGSPVVKIIPNPTRGSHEAYAVTQKGVYYIPDSTAASATWTNITGNLFNLKISPFGSTFNADTAVTFLTSMQADWRYVLPNDPKFVNSTGTHPILYVSGDAGVYRSLDNGTTWTPFPNQAFDNAPTDGGYLPNVQVNDLTIAAGAIDPTNGRAVAQPGDPNNLLATTFGRGQFTIRLAPIIFPTSVALDTKLPLPNGSVNGVDSQKLPIVTVAQPVIDGISEQTAFGNTVRISILDLTDPNNPHVIGGYDPSLGTTNNPTDVPANYTDSAGRFAVQVSPTGFTSIGIKTIGVQATDASGTQGNIVTLKIDLQAKLNSNTVPTTPTLGLNPADDTSGGQGITSNSSPHLIGTTDQGVTVSLYLSPDFTSPVATTTADQFGNFSFALANLPDGTYTYRVVATNANGASKPTSYTFTVRTAAPSVVPVLALLSSDDSGIPGDNITSIRRPHFVNAPGAPALEPGTVVTVYQYDPNAAKEVNPYPVSSPLGSATVGSNGNFSLQLPLSLVNGTTQLVAFVSDAAGNRNPSPSAPLTVTLTTVNGDYSGSGKTTPAVYQRADNGGGVWFLQGLPPAAGTSFGSATKDIPFTGDFDGSGVSSLALYRPSTNTWFIRRNSLGFETFTLGTPGTVPAIGDFDGDGVTDAAAYNPVTGTWTLAESSKGTVTVTMGGGFVPKSGDVPVPGNYNVAGNSGVTGPDLLAVYRPSTGHFYIQGPGGQVSDVFVPGWKSGDVPVPGNYDDSASYHRTEPAVYDPSNGAFTILGPSGAYTVTFSPGDIPAPGDYNGDGKADPAVYHTDLTGVVRLLYNTTNGTGGSTSLATSFRPTDIPLTAPLSYRNIPAQTPTLGLNPSSNTGFKGDSTTSVRQPVFSGKTDPNVKVDLIDSTGTLYGTADTDSNGNFQIQVNRPLSNGTYSFRARAHGSISSQGPVSAPVTVRLSTVDGDFVARGAAQPSLLVRPTGSARWFVSGVPALSGLSFGSSRFDIPVVADVDGDGKTDLLIYRPSTAQWFVARAATNYSGEVYAQFGTPNSGDIPLAADFLGSGRAHLALFRPATGQFFIGGQATPTVVIPGRVGDIPVPGNYDNTGLVEPAVFRPSLGLWAIQGPPLGPGAPPNVYSFRFGAGVGNVPVPGNYDGAATQAAVWNPNTGLFLIRKPDGSTRTIQFARGDIPVPADYEGTGYTEAAVYRPSTGQFFVVGPGQTAVRLLASTGLKNAVPLMSPYVYRSFTVAGAVRAQSAPTTVHAESVNIGATARAFSVGTSTTPTPAAPKALPTTVSTNLISRPRVRPHVAIPTASALRLFRILQASATRGPHHPG